MSDVRINTRSPYYIEANPTEPTVPETPTVPDPPANIPPTVTIVASNTNPYVGETVTLTAVATDSDGTIVSYLWGGTSSPQTSVSIDVTSSTVESKIFNVAVTDDDGDVGLDQITINWQEIPEQTTNTDLDVECGDVVNEGSFTGTKTYNLVGVGNKIGDVEIEFLGGGFNQNIPVLFDMSWNGATVSTGYIGYVDEAQGLSGVDNTGEPTTKGEPTTLTIFKSAATPTEVTLTATPFGTNDTYSFRLNCPDVEATETFYHTLTGTCTTGDTTFTYTDVNGDTQTVVLANGETQLVSAQDGTVVTAVCTGTVEKGGQSFDLGLPEQIVDTGTKFNIWLDSSGSLGNEINALRNMTDNELKNSFLQYYNNDSSLYNQRVEERVNNNERFFQWAGFGALTSSITKTVNLIYVDEGHDLYHKLSVGDNTQPQEYLDDISALRNKLDIQTNFGDHLAVIFCIEKTSYEVYRAFSYFVDNVTTGANGYDGSNGLSDRSEIIFVRNVLPNQSSSYYHQVTLDALRDLGYNI